MESDVIWERIRKREQELFDQEDDYNQEKNKIEARQEDLEQRQNALKLLIESEQEEMRCFLSRHSLDYDAALSFFQELDQLQEESFYQYRQEMAQLFQQEERLSQQYRTDLYRLEDTISQLRRDYSNGLE
ncbi:hypothetical protein JNE33_06240 [Streptococcus suis]|uniref:hypothetical protein n=1 Tax=Streptococcus suis TaxID=1307 RepID=UPI00192DDDB8|nr:hypothetical protein [Streptococcus suis]MBL6440107.1 hypothetical protein [Streptococcus suis]